MEKNYKKIINKRIALMLAFMSIFGDKAYGMQKIISEKNSSELPVSGKYQPNKLLGFENTKDLINYLMFAAAGLGTLGLILLVTQLIHYFNDKKNRDDRDKNNNLKKLIGVDDNDEINKKAFLSDELLKRYLKSPVIPKSIIEISSNIKGGIYHSDFSEVTYKNDKLAQNHSYPYNDNEKKTELEKDLYKLIDDGLVSLQYTTKEQLDRLIATVKNNSGSAKMPAARFYDGGEHDERNVPGTDFFRYKSAENSMAVVCSQYNALEAFDDEFSSLLYWFGDGTQGPRLSLSARLYALLRTLLYLKNKLNDAIDEVLGKKLINLSVGDGHKLYQHGYLNLARAYYCSSFGEDNWQILKNAVTNNISKYKLNFQWVLCNNGTPMIQVFAAAPCMQGMSGWWNKPKAQEIEKYCNPICMAIQVHQMSMIGKLAKLRRMICGKPFAIHVWLPGGRSFANHPYVLQAAAEAFIDEVRDVDIDVYFHNRTKGNPLEKALIAKKVEFKTINGLELK